MKHYTKADSPRSVVQAGTVGPSDRFSGGTLQLMEAVVIGVNYVDVHSNESANYASTVELLGTNRGETVSAESASGTQPDITPQSIGSRVECDVYILRTDEYGYGYQILNSVPVLQRGGFNDVDLWVPKASTNFVKQTPVRQNPSQLDGDVVIVGFIGGMFPTGAVILGAYPHRRNFRDHPRSLVGDARHPRRYGDGTRKDGNVRLVRYNGTVAPYIDRTGNLTFDTTEANRTARISETDETTITQDNIEWSDSQDIKEPGGGDVRFKIKNTRRFRVDFTNNQRLERGYENANPREFSETGYVQITQGSGTRVIDIDVGDEVILNVHNSGGGAGKLTINTDESIEGITLGGTALDRFATKAFVEELFMAHTHQTGTGPSSTPVLPGSGYLGIAPTPTGTGVEPLSGAKIFSTKVRGE